MKNKIQTIISFLLSLKIKNEVLVKREMQKRLKLYVPIIEVILKISI
jgi:hypothetical protein